MLVLSFLYEQDIIFNHAVWIQIFELFQCLFFLIKILNHCKVHVIFQDTEHQPEENVLYHDLRFSFIQNRY